MLPNPNLPWPIPMVAVALIAESEGCRLHAYRCPAGVPTLAWGRIDGVKMGDVCTQRQADDWLCDDLITRTAAVRAMCANPPGRNELGALVSLAYNIGNGALQGSTALRQHNAGNHQAASHAICLWDKARVNGALTTLAGLTARRAREQALYLTPDEPVAEALPQAVEAESKMTASPIAQGGATTVIAGIIAALSEARDYLGPVGEAFKAARGFFSDAVGVPASWVLPAVLIGAGVIVVRWRLTQRRSGRA